MFHSRQPAAIKVSSQCKNKLAPYGSDGRRFRTDVSANFKVTWHEN